MLNNDLYKEMERKYGKNKMLLFADMVSEMYGILYIDEMLNPLDNPLSEFDYERDWWVTRYVELSKELSELTS